MPTTQPTSEGLEAIYRLGFLLVGSGLTLISQYLSHRWGAAAKWKQNRSEESTKLYSRLIAVASDDLDRAKNLEALLAFMPGEAGESRTEWAKQWQRIDGDRHAARRRLWRLSFQARMMERDVDIKNQIVDLASRQLFFLPLGSPNNEYFGERWKQYKKSIEDYENLIKSIGDRVALKYGA